MKAHYLLLTLAWSIAAFGQDYTSQPADVPVAPASPVDVSVPPPSETPERSAEDLQNLTESIALYPDPLISVMLPAATYPLEIVKAARFVANTNNVPMIDAQPWDENVKAVAKFPEVIQKMSDNLDWTTDLGQAFIEQPQDLMDAIQTLRAKAQSAGALQTTPQ